MIRRPRYAWERFSRNFSFAVMVLVVVAFGRHADGIVRMFQ